MSKLKIVPQADSENPLTTGRRGLLNITGLGSLDCKLNEAVVLCNDIPTTLPCPDAVAIRNKARCIRFKTTRPGEYLIVLAVYDYGSSKVLATDYVVVVEGDPIPPPPPPTGDVTNVLIIEETADRTVANAGTISSFVLREEIEDRGWGLCVMEDDAVDQSGGRPEELSKWLKHTEKLPWWFFITDDGKALVSEPLPGPADAIKKVQEYQ